MIARTQQTKRIEDDTEEPEPVHTDEPHATTAVAINGRMASKEARGTYQLSRDIMPSSTQRGGETIQPVRQRTELGSEIHLHAARKYFRPHIGGPLDRIPARYVICLVSRASPTSSSDRWYAGMARCTAHSIPDPLCISTMWIRPPSLCRFYPLSNESRRHFLCIARQYHHYHESNDCCRQRGYFRPQAMGRAGLLSFEDADAQVD